MFLTDQEIFELTGRRQRTKQISWLLKNGIKHFINGIGRPVVPRAIIESSSSVPVEIAPRWKSART